MLSEDTAPFFEIKQLEQVKLGFSSERRNVVPPRVNPV